MRMTAGSVGVQRAAGARYAAGALCCVISIALLALGGCVAPKAAGNTLPWLISMSTGTEDAREDFAIRIPDDWNGRVVMLLRGAVPHQSVSATSSSEGSAESALLERRFAVATPLARSGRAAGIPTSGERLHIHFVLGFGSPVSVYLVGMSLGEHVALATIGKAAGEFDRALVYAPGGFMHASLPALQDTRTIELGLRADEPAAALLSFRLEIDRLDLAATLGFYYALLTGARNSPDRAWDGLRNTDAEPDESDLAMRTRLAGDFR